MVNKLNIIYKLIKNRNFNFISYPLFPIIPYIIKANNYYNLAIGLLCNKDVDEKIFLQQMFIFYILDDYKSCWQTKLQNISNNLFNDNSKYEYLLNVASNKYTLNTRELSKQFNITIDKADEFNKSHTQYTKNLCQKY